MKKRFFLPAITIALCQTALMVCVSHTEETANPWTTAESQPVEKPVSTAALSESEFTKASEPMASAGLPVIPVTARNARLSSDPREALLANAVTVASKETPADSKGVLTRTRLVRADFKYPFLRIEETVRRDQASGQEVVLSRREAVADHVIVKVRPEAEARLANVVVQLGGKIRKKMYKPQMYLIEFGPADLDTLPNSIAALQKVNAIEIAEPDYIGSINDTIPNDTNFNLLWGMHNTGQTIGGQVGVVDADIDAPAAWDISTGSSNIVVAVIDTGVDYNHPDLTANMWRNPGEIPGNGIDDDGNGFVDDVYGWDFANDDNDPFDDHYHGTHCAGTIGGLGNNGAGVAGVCWNVRIMAVKWILGSGSGATSDAIDAVHYTTMRRVRLTSNSWHIGVYSAGLESAIAEAGASNILFVCAAANSGLDLELNPDYPPNYTNANMIVVAATDNRDQRASFSNYGLVSVDLGAPGVNIWSCQPGNLYQYLSGTSMATPHVAGACALSLALTPDATALQIKQAILDGTEPIAALSNKCVTGGRLNIYNTLQELERNVAITPATGASFSGPSGGPFTPPSSTYTISNIGTNFLSWTATKTATWLELSLTTGSLLPGQSNVVVVSLNTNANALAVGTYTDTLTFSNTASATTITRPVTLEVVHDLLVTPSTSLVSGGPPGGPFNPASQMYVLSNTTASSLSWSTSNTQAWVSLSASSGSLAPGSLTNVTVSINASANALPSGSYSDTVIFSNVVNGVSQTRAVSVNVGQDFFTELFDTSANDLDNLVFTFTPNGSANFYSVCRASTNSFPVDPVGGTTLSLGDDSYALVALTGGATVSLYGTNYAAFYVGSNGYITFGSGDSTYVESFSSHFNLRRISALFDDLYPPGGGSVTWKQLGDRVAVTWNAVPECCGSSNPSSFQIEMFFDGKIRITCLTISQTDGLAGLSKGLGVPTGFIESDLSTYGPCVLPLIVTLPAVTTEGDGVLTNAGSVAIAATLSSNLLVNLVSGDTTEVAVPSSVTILAGQTNATFNITIVDDAELDGTQVASITATATGYDSGGGSIAVHDNETATLGVILPATATEGVGAVPGQITVSAPVATNVTVTLSSSDTTELTVPATVVIPAGQTNATFTATVINDTAIDGPQTATVTAHVQNWTDGSAVITVLDNETTNLVLTLPASVREGQGVLTNAGSVRISGTLPTPLTVNFASSDLTELIVPASVVIPAGQTNATFNLTVVDDAETDGTQPVTVTASATGFADGSALVSVFDNDLHHFAWGAISSLQTAGAPFSVTITAQDINSTTISNYPGPASLSGAGDGGPVTLSPTTSGAFSNGLWTGSLTVSTPDTNVLLMASDGAGHSGTSTPFNVVIGPLHHFTWSAIASTQYVGSSFPVSVSARDAANNPVTGFTNSVALSGRQGGTSTNRIMLTDLGYDTTSSGTYTRGIRFQPTNTMTVTHVRHFWGTKVSIWTDSGVLVASKNVVSTNGTWLETPLDSPVVLTSGTVYRVAGYAAGGTYYYRSNGGMPINFSDGVILNGAYSNAGDTFPDSTSTVRYLVDLRYTVGSSSFVAITPTNSGNFVSGVWNGSVTVLQTATNMYLRADDGSGHSGTGNVLNAVYVGTLAVTLPASATEGDGVLVGQGSVSVTSAPPADLTVNLTSSDLTELTVPASVIIPAGQTNATFDLTIVNDAELDGAQPAMVTATALAYASGQATMTIQDNETATLMLQVPATATEGNAPVLATLFASAPPATNVTVSLTSSDLTEATVPASVVLPAGQTSVVFNVTIINDTLIDGPQPVTITAHFQNWTDGVALLTVLDNESTNLVLTLPAQVSEGNGVLTNAGHVAISGTLGSDLVVALASSDTTELTVPSSITIPAGQTNAAFNVTVVDDAETDGTQTACVTASAAGFVSGTACVQVLDNEPPVPFGPIPTNGAVGVAIDTDLTWNNTGPVFGAVLAIPTNVAAAVLSIIERSGIRNGPITIASGTAASGGQVSGTEITFTRPDEIANVRSAVDAGITPLSGMNVAVCGAVSTASWLTDVQTKLLGTGQFNSVAIINVNSVTPTLTELQAFDAVMVFSDASYANATVLGDVMADYTDQGGGVVCMMFENGGIPMQGRWNSQSYYAIPRSGQYQGTSATLGTAYDPSHPILQGVTAFSGGGSSYRTITNGISAGSVRVADWSDGRPLVVTKVIGGTPRADIAFYPVSSDIRSDFWTASTDGARLMANALTWVAGGGSGSANYFVYFGTNTVALSLIASNLTQTACDPGLLGFNTTYYWQVIASNAVGCATGTVWSFTTANDMVQFGSATYSVGESDGTAAITVTRANGSLGGVTVDYATSNGTATAGSDYVMTSGTLVFAAGQLTNSFTVPILDDGTTEGNETVQLLLTNPSAGVVLGAPNTAILTISDDDGFFDDFDPGIDLPLWSAFGGTVGSTVLATNYGGFVSSPNSLWFGDSGSRYAATKSLNTSGGGTIGFYLRFGNGVNPWETVDLPAEGVVAEYAIGTNTTWTILGTYNTTNYYSWTPVSLAIPVAAQGPSVRFRWRQLSHSGSCCDHWALDNVMINIIPIADLSLTMAGTPLTVVVGDPLTYSLTVSNAGPFAASSVTVTDTLPADVSFVSATASQGSWVYSNATVTASLGSLSTGTVTTVQIVVTPNVSGTLCNTGSVTATTTDLNAGNNSAQVCVVVPVDADNDQMPDTWERANGFDPHDPNDAAVDSDGDGRSNLTEFLSGTDPTNSVSYWHIQASPTNGLVPLTVNFVDNSTGSSITNRLWNFGDGGVGSGTNPSHTYTNAGTFSVGLTIFNLYGTATLVAPNLITVSAPPWGYWQTVTNASPVAYWRLNETNGATVAVDFLGLHNGTISASVTPGVSGPRNPPFPGFETNNTAIQFNYTSGSYLTMPALNLNTNRVTICGWIKPMGNQAGWAGIAFCRGGSTVAGLHFGPGSIQNELRYTWNNSRWDRSTGLVVPTGQWSFVALVVTPTNGTIYIGTNGVLNSVTDAVSEPIQAFGTSLLIGYDPCEGSRLFRGVIDEVAIYNHSLTPTQIQDLYNSAFSTPPPPLTPFQMWQFWYFGCTNCPQAAETADPDGDGQNNMTECLVGTDPTDSASAFRIVSIAQEGSNIRVTWNTGGGTTNAVEFALNVGGTYSNISPDIIITGSGDTTTNHLDVGAATNFPSRFYRVRLLP